MRVDAEIKLPHEIKSNDIQGFHNSEFPITDEGRTYHVGTKSGEVANRIVTVGEIGRALSLAKHLKEPVFKLTSKRQFTTITGTFNDVAVSIVAIGMGVAMMDMFVREVRAITSGPLAIVRFGSCGSIGNARLGNVVVADGSVMLHRNYDHFLGDHNTEPYLISKICPANKKLSELLMSKMEENIGHDRVKLGLNTTADCFYSSQGRLDKRFYDNNGTLIKDLKEKHPQVETLEMETFMLLHLANCSRDEAGNQSIHAAGSAMIFAERNTGNFIEPELVADTEMKGGKALIETVASYTF